VATESKDAKRQRAVIRTFTGKMVDLLDPKPEAIDIRDIAHALAQINRFTGHTRTPYSVAEHCVIGSETIRGELALDFLLHDATEAYLGDVSGPLKRVMGGQYAWLEQDWARAVATRFDLDPGEGDSAQYEVERIDKLMLDCELDVLMGLRMPLARRQRLAPESWNVMRALENRTGHAESRFLARYDELQLRRGRRGERAR
jgi:uncharacterized protein